MKGYFQNRLDKSYQYFPLPNGTADIFVFDLSSEKEVVRKAEDGEYTEYEYEMNEFNENMGIVKEKDVKANPLAYLKYTTSSPITLEELYVDVQYAIALSELNEELED